MTAHREVPLAIDRPAFRRVDTPCRLYQTRGVQCRDCAVDALDLPAGIIEPRIDQAGNMKDAVRPPGASRS